MSLLISAQRHPLSLPSYGDLQHLLQAMRWPLALKAFLHSHLGRRQTMFKASGAVLGIIDCAVHWPRAFAVMDASGDCNGTKTLL